MLVEKYIVIGIKISTSCVTDITRQNTYVNTNLIDPISVIREQRNDIFVDFDGPFITKNKAFDRILKIKYNVSNIMYWSVLPVVVDVSIKEARYLKLIKIKKKLIN